MAGLLVIYFSTYTSEAQTNNNVLETVYFPLALIEYGEELSQLHSIVNDFLALRGSPDGPDAKTKAMELDNKINSLEIVKNYCSQQISTLELAHESDPYAGLQQICPILKNLTFSKAAELFGKL